MRQYSGPMNRSCCASSFSSSLEKLDVMAFRFSSSWSISVMLGIVVPTFGLRSTHFNAANIAPSRFSLS